jgi:hypothetical protein
LHDNLILYTKFGAEYLDLNSLTEILVISTCSSTILDGRNFHTSFRIVREPKMVRLSMNTQDNKKANISKSWPNLACDDTVCLSTCLHLAFLAAMFGFALLLDVRVSADILEKAAIPVFPGAEGAGAFTPGGRRGRVFEVTNLNDAGTGSLREAIEAEGSRIVIFRVPGGQNGW